MTKITTDKNKIKELLERGVDKVIEKEHLEKQLLAGKRLRLYFGIDPTSPVLHLGHSIVLRKLQKFQELGHEVILLIGDFTATIGDPTDKEATRKPLTAEQVRQNMKDYKKQAAKILDFTKVKLAYNSNWLSKLNFGKVLEIASHLSVQRLLTRDMFEKRMKQGKMICLHEFLYPMMQGYDSVAMDVDLEIAGADQLFNMLIGRELQKIYNHKNKDVLTTQLITGTDGRKMSKTFSNTIAITAKPNDMFGKIMSMQDELLGQYFELCTDMPLKEIKKIETEIKNPKDRKVILAKEIVKMYHSPKAADRAQKEFEKVFSKKEAPTEIPVFQAKKPTYQILDLLAWAGLAKSKAEARRLVSGKAVEIDNEIKDNWQEKLVLKNNSVIKVGKHRFVKIKI